VPHERDDSVVEDHGTGVQDNPAPLTEDGPKDRAEKGEPDQVVIDPVPEVQRYSRPSRDDGRPDLVPRQNDHVVGILVLRRRSLANRNHDVALSRRGRLEIRKRNV
jgi:hypothetical protein